MFQSSISRLTLLGALVVGGLVMLERVTEPAQERVARERPKTGRRTGGGTRPVAQAPGGPAQSATGPLHTNLRDIPTAFFSLN